MQKKNDDFFLWNIKSYFAHHKQHDRWDQLVICRQQGTFGFGDYRWHPRAWNAIALAIQCWVPSKLWNGFSSHHHHHHPLNPSSQSSLSLSFLQCRVPSKPRQVPHLTCLSKSKWGLGTPTTYQRAFLWLLIQRFTDFFLFCPHLLSDLSTTRVA